MSEVFRGFRVQAGRAPPVVGAWTTGTVTSMRGAFRDVDWNPDVDGWETGSVRDFRGMFRGAANFNRTLSHKCPGWLWNANYKRSRLQN